MGGVVAGLFVALDQAMFTVLQTSHSVFSINGEVDQSIMVHHSPIAITHAGELRAFDPLNARSDGAVTWMELLFDGLLRLQIIFDGKSSVIVMGPKMGHGHIF
jgi:hypothetical protein